MKLFKFKNEIYTEETTDLYTTGVKIEVPVVQEVIRWNGAKYPFDQYLQTLDFFEKGYEKTKSECLVFLYYDIEAGDWITWAPPQICDGMTVKADKKDPLYKEQRAAIPCSYIQFGSIHNHCTGGAGVSGVDVDDEKDRDGLHITIGKIATPNLPYDIHSRATIKGITELIAAEEWVEFPEMPMIPVTMLQKVKKSMLTYLVAEDLKESPAEWLENAHEAPPAAINYPTIPSYAQTLRQEEIWSQQVADRKSQELDDCNTIEEIMELAKIDAKTFKILINSNPRKVNPRWDEAMKVLDEAGITIQRMRHLVTIWQLELGGVNGTVDLGVRTI